MNDEFSKLFKFLSKKDIFKNTEIPPSAKIISVNMVGAAGIEPAIFRLQGERFTTKLKRQ